MMRPYKFQIVAIVQETDDDGTVTGEATIAGAKDQPIIVYGVAALAKWAAEFEANLSKASAERQGEPDAH